MTEKPSPNRKTQILSWVCVICCGIYCARGVYVCLVSFREAKNAEHIVALQTRATSL